ncbi:DDE-type integrase/transposase/recombinase [Microvirga tunisiensis]|uniref:DDE-type integrase/transposase/recombinase n=1 Tax=Pannonibacter tanglangensis TaxID=2750084 RepID=A0A7X5F3Z0_9HYPH|nr:DDE-type integrase/transposase/recombinase [Pannonibacter sp. XCT-53]
MQLVRQHLDIGQSRGAIDGDVQEVMSHARSAVATVAGDAVANALETGELLEVEMETVASVDQLAAPNQLLARQRLETAKAHPRQPSDAVGTGQIQLRRDLPAGQSILPPQLLHGRAAIPAASTSGRRGVRKLVATIKRRGKPNLIVSDNGTEVTSNAVLTSAQAARMAWHFIAPGKPMQNGFCESFNGRMRDELAKRDAVSGP